MRNSASRARASARRALRCAALWCACAAVAALAAEPARPPLTVESLMAEIAKSRGLVTAFTETKQLALLDGALQSTGSVYFMPPDRFARITETPAKGSMVLHGDQLRIRNAVGADDVIQLDSRSREFVDTLIVVFRGDAAELRRRFDARIEGEGANWKLVLRPRGALVQRLIQSITLSGTGRAPKGIVVEETGGDRTTTVFEHSDLDHVFSAEEQEKLFSLGPR